MWIHCYFWKRFAKTFLQLRGACRYICGHVIHLWILPGDALPKQSHNCVVPLWIHFVDTGVETHLFWRRFSETPSDPKTTALSYAGVPSLDCRSSTRKLIQNRKGVERTASDQKPKNEESTRLRGRRRHDHRPLPENFAVSNRNSKIVDPSGANE